MRLSRWLPYLFQIFDEIYLNFSIKILLSFLNFYFVLNLYKIFLAKILISLRKSSYSVTLSQVQMSPFSLFIQLFQ